MRANKFCQSCDSGPKSNSYGSYCFQKDVFLITGDVNKFWDKEMLPSHPKGMSENIFKKITAIAIIVLCSTVLYAQDTIAVTDSLPEAKHRPSVKAVLGIAIPTILITYGALSFDNGPIRQLDYNIHNRLVDEDKLLHTKVDNYLQFAPAALAFGLKIGGVKSVHKLSDMCIIYALSNVLEGGLVQGLKHITGRERPDGSSNHSFPSGHTATAFVAAEFLHHEYGNQSVWISVGGYAIASATGVLRIYNNKHWLSDVVAGAGIGILSVKTVYWLYPCLQRKFCTHGKPLQTFVFPGYSEGCLTLNISKTF